MATYADTRLPERFWSKVEPGDECWRWTGALTLGYGSFRVGGRGSKLLQAHRHAYLELVGPVAAGLVLDHLCRTRSCVNPDHLEPVTIAENIRRGVGASALNAAKIQCDSGHPFNEANTYTTGRGWRRCRECSRRHKRESYWRAKVRAANLAL